MNRRSRKASVGAPLSKETQEAINEAYAAEDRKAYDIWLARPAEYKAANPWTGKIPGAELAKAAN
jgi:hypothetical protein